MICYYFILIYAYYDIHTLLKLLCNCGTSGREGGIVCVVSVAGFVVSSEGNNGDIALG